MAVTINRDNLQVNTPRNSVLGHKKTVCCMGWRGGFPSSVLYTHMHVYCHVHCVGTAGDDLLELLDQAVA